MVIVTDTEYRMTLALVRDLKEAGERVLPVCADTKRSLFSNARYLKKDRYGDDLLSLCRENPGSVLLPAGRLSVAAVAARRDDFKAAAKVLISPAEVITLADDKEKISRLAASLGLRVPRSYSLAEEERITYPCIIKYVCGEALGLQAKNRYFLASDKESLTNICSRLAGPYIIQEKIEGQGFGVSLLMKGGRAVDGICHRRIRELPESGGPSVCCEAVDGGALVYKSELLLSNIGFEGVAMVEWKGSGPESAAFLEINPRIWGSYPLVRASKSCFSQNWARASRGEPLKDPFCARAGSKMQFFPGELALLYSRLREKNLRGAAEILKDLFSPRVKDGVLSLKDLRGSAAYVKSLFKRRSQ